MRSSIEQIDVAALESTWAAFDRVARLRPIRTGQEYERMVALLNCLLDVVGDRKEHALSGLLDLVGELVSEYDALHYPVEASEPREVLRYLMQARGLKQADLAAIVAQGNLSAILAGKRRISAALAGKLGRYFGVSPAVFLAG